MSSDDDSDVTIGSSESMPTSSTSVCSSSTSGSESDVGIARDAAPAAVALPAPVARHHDARRSWQVGPVRTCLLLFCMEGITVSLFAVPYLCVYVAGSDSCVAADGASASAGTAPSVAVPPAGAVASAAPCPSVCGQLAVDHQGMVVGAITVMQQ